MGIRQQKLSLVVNNVDVRKMSEHMADTTGAVRDSTPLDTSLALLQRAQAGDAEALNALASRYLPRLRRWTTRRLPGWARDLAETDDLVQDSLLATLRSLDRFTPAFDGALQAYLRTAILNRVRMEIGAPAMCPRWCRSPRTSGSRRPRPSSSPWGAKPSPAMKRRSRS